MGEWVEVTGAKVPPVEVQDRAGVHIQLLVSPYDVPQAVRGRYDDQKRRFYIDLMYMSTEPTEQQASGDLMLAVGRRSGRIYGVEVDVGKRNLGGIALEIVKQKLDTALTRFGEGAAYAANSRAVQATLTSTPAIYRELSVAH